MPCDVETTTRPFNADDVCSKGATRGSGALIRKPVVSRFVSCAFAVLATLYASTGCGGSEVDPAEASQAKSDGTAPTITPPTTAAPTTVTSIQAEIAEEDSASRDESTVTSAVAEVVDQRAPATNTADGRFDSAGIGGLNAGESPEGLDDDQVAARRTLLVTLDPSVAFEDKVSLVETGEAVEAAHDGLMATIEMLAGQMEMTEPLITVSNDRADLNFSVRSPAIGEIVYDVNMRRGEDTAWVVSEDSFCDAVALSGLQCR